MENQDIRWQQRLANYSKALGQLSKFIEKGNLNELEEQGLIKAFEYTYELAWNVLKDFLIDRGNTNIYGSRDALREAFSAGLIEDGNGWMEMYRDRNKTSHTYNEETADEISRNVFGRYFPLFVALRLKMEALSERNHQVERVSYGLDDSTIREICSVFSRYPQVERVILYGSRAMGRERNGSDIDLTMVGEGITHSLQLEIENELDDLLLPYKIDLSIMRQIDNADLLDHIRRVGVIFFERSKLGG